MTGTFDLLIVNQGYLHRELGEHAIEIGNAVERDLARELGEGAAAHIRSGLERLAYDPPWGEAAPARAGRIW